MTKPGRIACCVPHCQRTFRAGEDINREYLCGRHWQMVSPTLRGRKLRFYARYLRLYGDAPFWHFPAGSPKRIASVRLDRICRKIWERAKRQAIERAGGI